MASRPSLKLYLDVVSPFAYMAFHFVHNSSVFKQCDVQFIPVFLGGIMQACGNTAPMKIKNKGEYMNVERQNWATKYNIPLSSAMPPNFPPNTISAQRALCAIELSDQKELPAAFAALWDAFWVRAEPIEEKEVYCAAIVKALGKARAEQVLGSIGSNEVKGRLKENTETALAEGAFGLPWFVATNAQGQTKKFWGFDHIGLVVDHLGLERGSQVKAMM